MVVKRFAIFTLVLLALVSSSCVPLIIGVGVGAGASLGTYGVDRYVLKKK